MTAVAVSRDGAKRSAWSVADLERRLCHSLEIADRCLDRLASTGYSDPGQPEHQLRPEKVISETALLLNAASHVASPDVRGRVTHVAHRLAPHARSQRMLLAMCLEPTLTWDYAQAHVCLRALGHDDSTFDAMLRRGLESQARFGRERPPHRMLEQGWVEAIWSGHRVSSRSSAVLESVLNRPMDLLSGSRDDVYAFTHAVMYVAHFDDRPVRLPRRRATILAEAEAALARCLDEEDYDLGAEVVLAWPLTGKSWSAAATFAFSVIARVEDDAGFLPSAGTRLDRLAKLSGDERTDYLLATAYHTAYVMGLVCAAALRAGHAPPTSVRAHRASNGAGDAMLEMIGDDDRRRHWRDDVSRLNREQRDSIAGLLLDMALRRKVERRDFGAVAELLRRAYALGLADRPACGQAAELLERIALFAELQGRSTSSS